jgi:hypothetical protein
MNQVALSEFYPVQILIPGVINKEQRKFSQQQIATRINLSINHVAKITKIK